LALLWGGCATASGTPLVSGVVNIVGVRFLNARPLLAGLEAGLPAPFPYRLTTAEPAECAEEFEAGRAVAGLVPVATLPFLPIVRAVPGLGIAARGAAKSVLLISRVPLEEIRTSVVEDIKTQWDENRLNELLAEWKKAAKIDVHEAALAKAAVRRTDVYVPGQPAPAAGSTP